MLVYVHFGAACNKALALASNNTCNTVHGIANKGLTAHGPNGDTPALAYEILRYCCGPDVSVFVVVVLVPIALGNPSAAPSDH